MAPTGLRPRAPTSTTGPAGLFRGQAAFLAAVLSMATLLLFTASVTVALVIVAVWYVIPSAHGRGGTCALSSPRRSVDWAAWPCGWC